MNKYYLVKINNDWTIQRIFFSFFAENHNKSLEVMSQMDKLALSAKPSPLVSNGQWIQGVTVREVKTTEADVNTDSSQWESLPVDHPDVLKMKKARKRR